MNEGKDENISGWHVLKHLIDVSREQAAQIVPTISSTAVEAECDHKDKWRIHTSPLIIIRMCSGCGQSWRLPTRGDYTGDEAGSFPSAEWEEIKEPMEVQERVLPDYEE